MLTTAILLAASFLQAAPVPVPPDSPALHIVSKTDPVYPPIARAAHVTGTVRIQAQIDSSGNVTNLRVLGGPPMLQGAALDAARKWKYAPIVLDGVPASVTTTLSIDFTLPGPHNPNDEKIARGFFPLSDLCHSDFANHADAPKTAADCAKAAEAAETFSTQERFIERRGAFVYASTAYLRNKQINEALSYAQKAVAVVAQGHDDGSGSSAAYSVLAQAEAVSGDLAKASEDLTKSEDYERVGIKDLSADAPDLVKNQYIPTLRGLLRFHAQVLRALGQTEAANKKEAEAAAL